MDKNIEKKFSAFEKFGRAVAAEKLFINEFSKTNDPFLAFYYIERFLIPKKQYTLALDILIKIDERYLNVDSKNTFFEVYNKVTTLENKPVVIADMLSIDFAEFEKFSLKFLIKSEKKPLGNEFVEISSYELAKMLCHDQNIRAPYKSWNSFRSAAANKVFKFIFDEKIKCENFSSEFLYKISDYLKSIVFGENLNFFDDVVGDLNEIGRGILVGKIIAEHKKMFQAYEAGYFPCGLREDGRIVVLRWQPDA